MRFYGVKEMVLDEPTRKACVDWAIDELRLDVEKNRDNIVCFVYGISYRMKTNGGVRLAMMSKTGGGDEIKPLLQGLTESEGKSRIDILAAMPFWQRMAFRLLMSLPKMKF